MRCSTQDSQSMGSEVLAPMARSKLLSAVMGLVVGEVSIDVGSLTERLGSDIESIRTLSKHQLSLLITFFSDHNPYCLSVSSATDAKKLSPNFRLLISSFQ